MRGGLKPAKAGALFTVITGASRTKAFAAGSVRPNLLRDPSLGGDQQSITHWFDTSAFAAPAPYTFGNSPRSGLRGARLVTTDFTLEKSVRLKEKVKLDVRGEFYNLLNHANFNVPGSTFGAADFGLVTSPPPRRPVQLAARASF